MGSKALVFCALASLAAGGSADEVAVTPRLDARELGRSKLDKIHTLQRAFVDEKICLSNVAMVAKNGRVIYHRAVASSRDGDRPITADTLFPIWSMTKPITSVAAMILRERGAFRLDDPASKAIPQLAQLRVQSKGGGSAPLAREITYRDLLRHTSGIYGYDGSFHESGTWKEVMELHSLAELIDLLELKPLQHQPSERYTYGLSTAVMGRVIEVLTGKSLAEFLEKEVFEPLGMKHTRFHLTGDDRRRFQPLFVKEGDQFRLGTLAEDELHYAPESALFLGGEGLVSTIEDYGRFCQMLVDRGKAPGGVQLLSGESLDLMLTDQLGHLRGDGDAGDGNIQGLGFYVLRDTNREHCPGGIFGWGGYHTTHFWIDPENELYAVFMTRLYPSPDETLSRFRKAVYDVLAAQE